MKLHFDKGSQLPTDNIKNSVWLSRTKNLIRESDINLTLKNLLVSMGWFQWA